MLVLGVSSQGELESKEDPISAMPSTHHIAG